MTGKAKDALDGLRAFRASTKRLTRPQVRSMLCAIYAHMPTATEREAMLQTLIAANQEDGLKRGYVETRSGNLFALSCRYVSPGKAERSNASRYSCALTYMKKTGVDPDAFFDYLDRNGGITAIYAFARDRGSRTTTRQRISLNTPITVQYGTTINLRLIAEPNGIFTVLQCEET